MFSGGVGSWAAAKRVVAAHGTENTKLLFTDTNFEDEDTYRFLHEAAANTGAELIILDNGGKDIWDVFKHNKFLGNSRVDICSRVLKREPADKWIRDNYAPDEVICYIGIDWSEIHRYERLHPRKLPYIYKAPLCDPPYLTKAEIQKWAESEGIEQQRLYKIGMPHANCGGGCVKAGLGHWRQLYRQWPERYKLWEQKEQQLYTDVPNAKPFLRKTENGIKRYLTLKELREEYLDPEAADAKCRIDMYDFGGCGCFSDIPEEENDA